MFCKWIWKPLEILYNEISGGILNAAIQDSRDLADGSFVS